MNPRLDTDTRPTAGRASREAGPAPAPLPSGSKASLSARRLMIASLQADAEEYGRPELARALHRLGLMTEFCECLSEESPDKAAEVAEYCAEALERLTSIHAFNEAEVTSLVLHETAERWGDYLNLIEPGGGDDPTVEAPAPAAETIPVEETGPSIDPEILLRLLAGTKSPAPKPPPERPTPGAKKRPAPPKPAPVATGAWDLLGLGPSLAAEPKPSAADRRPRVVLDVPAPPSSVAIDPELRDTFLAEATDLFDRIETLVLGLGRGESQGQALHELGRCLHTLKGAAGSVDLNQLAALVHGVEEVLEEARGVVDDDLVDVLHKLLHYLEGVFQALRGGSAPSGYSAPQPPAPAPPRAAAPAPKPAASRPTATPGADTSRAATAQQSKPQAQPQTPTPTQPLSAPSAAPAKDAPAGEGPVRVASERIDELMDIVSELISRRGLWAAQADAMKDFAAQARTCRARMLATIDRIRDARLVYDLDPSAGHRRESIDRQADVPELIRRLVEQSDDLLVLTETAQATAKPLADNSESLARLKLQLWESLQAIRIVPVRGLFQRLMRVAHDAARVEGRQVEVVTVGEETGLDRAVQDKAFEPLLHVVRNAVCHGIEPAEERVRRGKPACGRITLEASRTGNTLSIVVKDDGRGLDYDAIAEKGRRLGLIGPDDRPCVDRLNALVFQSGFSTREEANAIAGRGVGMDVVSQEVARLHGTVSLSSQPGTGTRLSIVLPARLALEQSIVARVDGQAFALPVELIELAQPFEAVDAEVSGGRTLVRMRDELVPLISAREALGLPDTTAASCPKVLLMRVEGSLLAVLVDAIDGARELVIKPLGPLLTGHPVVVGSSLSVTGEVIFALSPAGLARWEREGVKGVVHAGLNPPAPGRPPVLVVDDSISVRKVVARQLRALNYEVEEVSDGLEALGRVRSRSYCLVLTDIEMPRMDGFELLAELGRLSISPALPVVAASTRTDAETRRRVLSLGARRFISKPIDPEVLAETIGSLLGNVGGHAGAGHGPARAAVS